MCKFTCVPTNWGPFHVGVQDKHIKNMSCGGVRPHAKQAEMSSTQALLDALFSCQGSGPGKRLSVLKTIGGEDPCGGRATLNTAESVWQSWTKHQQCYHICEVQTSVCLELQRDISRLAKIFDSARHSWHQVHKQFAILVSWTSGATVWEWDSTGDIYGIWQPEYEDIWLQCALRQNSSSRAGTVVREEDYKAQPSKSHRLRDSVSPRISRADRRPPSHTQSPFCSAVENCVPSISSKEYI